MNSADQTIPPWTTTECELCGQTGLATRSEPGKHPYTCSECKIVEKFDQENQALLNEIAELKRLLALAETKPQTNLLVGLPLEQQSYSLYVRPDDVVRVVPDPTVVGGGSTVVCRDGAQYRVPLITDRIITLLNYGKKVNGQPL